MHKGTGQETVGRAEITMDEEGGPGRAGGRGTCKHRERCTESSHTSFPFLIETELRVKISGIKARHEKQKAVYYKRKTSPWERKRSESCSFYFCVWFIPNS